MFFASHALASSSDISLPSSNPGAPGKKYRPGSRIAAFMVARTVSSFARLLRPIFPIGRTMWEKAPQANRMTPPARPPMRILLIPGPSMIRHRPLFSGARGVEDDDFHRTAVEILESPAACIRRLGEILRYPALRALRRGDRRVRIDDVE